MYSKVQVIGNNPQQVLIVNFLPHLQIMLSQRSLKNVDRTSADSGDWIFHFWVKTDRFDKYLYFVVQLILTVQPELFELLRGVLEYCRLEILILSDWIMIILSPQKANYI